MTRHLCVKLLSGKTPDMRRPPDFDEQRKRSHRDNRRYHVDEPWTMKVGDQELRYSKADTCYQDGGPDFQHAPETRKRPDQPKRHDQREERKLTTNHGAQLFQVKSRDALQTNDRCSQSSVSYWRCVGYQR